MHTWRVVLVILAWAAPGPPGRAEEPAKALTPPERQRLEKEAVGLDAEVEKLYAAGDAAQAYASAGKALAVRQKLYPTSQFPDGHADLANSLDNLGAVLWAQGRYTQAQSYLEQASAMRRKLYPAAKFPDGHPDLALSLNNLGTLLRDQGRYAQALPYYEQALATYQKLYPPDKFPDGHPRLALSLNNLGSLLQDQGRYAEALPYYERALAMRQSLYPPGKYPDGHPDLAFSLNNLAHLLWAQGRFAEALPYYERALAMRKSLYPRDKYPEGHPDLAFSLNNLGFLLQAQGRRAQALPYYEQALAMRKKLYPLTKFPNGHPDLALSLNNLGALLRDQGRYAQALPCYEQALAMYKNLYPPDKYPDGHPSLALSLNNLGGLLQAQGRYTEALDYYERALALRQKLYPEAKYPDGHPELAVSLNNLASVLRDQGRYTRALAYYDRALAMRQKLYPKGAFSDGHPDLALSLNNMGSLLQEQGRYAQALPYLKQALAMYQRLAERFAEGASESEALAQGRSLPPARDALLSVCRHLPERAERTYDLLWSGRDALSRIWQQRHLTAVAAAGRPEVRSHWNELLEIRRRLARLLLQPLPRDPAALAERDREVQQLSDRKEQLERELSRRLPALAAAQGAPSRPADLEAALPPHTAFFDLLQYTLIEQDPKVAGKEGERRTLCYIAFVMQTGRPLRRVELGEAARIDQALGAWRRAMDQRQDSLAATRLRRLVWEPLEKELAAGTEAVYLAPDGALTRLPWAALPRRRPDTVLLEDYTLAIVEHGPQLLAALRRPAAAPGRGGAMLLVGGVRYDQAPTTAAKDDRLALRGPERDGALTHWDYLSGTARELRLVKEAADGRPLAVLKETSASVRRVLAELPQARLAHVATHGFFNEAAFRAEKQREAELVTNYAFAMDRQLTLAGQGARSPLAYTGLVLAGANIPDKAGPEGGILTGELLLGVNLKGLDLVVLSACQTGLGEVADSQHVQNMGMALHAAGCRDVIASLWNVPDDATAALMALFYDELLHKGRPPLEALRQAQLYVYRHPGQLQQLAERAAPRRDVEEKVPAETTQAATPAAPQGRAAVKDWAGFFLSGPGR